MSSFFSIIIPTYNRADLIAKTIESVLQQSFSDFEIIIVDDGSTDNTEDTVRSFSDKRIIYLKKKNEERAVARNTGTKIAKGTYITFLDSDDIFYSDHLFLANKVIIENELPEIFHTRYEIITPQNDIIEQKPLLDANINRKLILGNFMSCNGVFLRKDIALENPFNEDRELSALEDWELWLRIAVKYQIRYSNTITSAIINHEFRSVSTSSKDALVTRCNVLLKLVLNNSEILNYFSTDISKFKANCYTYLSLHLALTKKNRNDSLYYLIKGIKENCSVVFTRRFLAILKHLI